MEARIDLDRGFIVEGTPASATSAAALTILRTDLDGVPRPDAGRWSLFRLKEPSGAVLPADEPEPTPEPEEGESAPPLRTSGDQLRPRLSSPGSIESVMRRWPEVTKIASADVTTDDKGVIKVPYPALTAGAYRLMYETIDPFGARYHVVRDLVVAGQGAVPAVPIALLAERSTVSAGETARFLAGSGLPDQPMLLEVHRGEERVLRRFLQSGKDAPLIELPVKEADRGGFTVSLTLVRDHQWMTQTETIHVPRDDKTLKVEMATFRDLVRPGAKERFRVKVSGSEGAVAAGAAEVLAYMYDRSLDFFVPHQPPSLGSLYPGAPLAAVPAREPLPRADLVALVPGAPGAGLARPARGLAPVLRGLRHRRAGHPRRGPRRRWLRRQRPGRAHVLGPRRQRRTRAPRRRRARPRCRRRSPRRRPRPWSWTGSRARPPAAPRPRRPSSARTSPRRRSSSRSCSPTRAGRWRSSSPCRTR